MEVPEDILDKCEEFIFIELPAKDTLLSDLLSCLRNTIRRQDSKLNDTIVVCQDAEVKVPSFLLAALSPLFKATGGVVAPDSEFFSLILPSVTKSDFEVFLDHVCDYQADNEAQIVANMERLREIMDMLCCDYKVEDDVDRLKTSVNALDETSSFKVIISDSNKENETPTTPKRRRYRKRQVKDEPYTKTEVMTKERQSASYGLRKTIKRTRFTDQFDPFTDDLGLDAEGDLDLSSESSDYAPDSDVEDMDEDFEDPDFEDEETDLELLQCKYIVKAEGNDSEVHVVESKPDDSQVLAVVVPMSCQHDDDDALVSRYLESKSSNPRSLLKTVVLLCAGCTFQCSSLEDMKRHCLEGHKDSVLVSLPDFNPHRHCSLCTSAVTSYHKHLQEMAEDLCFTCPHCHRRFGRKFIDFANHVSTDHRDAVSSHSPDEADSIPFVLPDSDERVRQCVRCSEKFENLISVNRHLSCCPKRDVNLSHSMHCQICGSAFGQEKLLRSHIQTRHKGDRRIRFFLCKLCPVACLTEAGLEQHVVLEHSDTDPDDGFVLHHPDCQRCRKLYESYLKNKDSGQILTQDLAFKCPHCCMILFAHPKHAPRYLHNHTVKFHMDKETNDFSCQDDDDLPILSKQDPSIFTCQFCKHHSFDRGDHNEHLSQCESSTVPCKPGYMCDSCGFIGGTSRALRLHLKTHVQQRLIKKCSRCPFLGSKQEIKTHVARKHGRQNRKRKMTTKTTGTTTVLESNQITCNDCGKTYKGQTSFRNHLRKVCGKGSTRIKCQDCDMDFKRKEDMQAHALIHYGKVTCPIHNILFKQESEIFQHVNQAGPEDKMPLLQCCMCSSSFKHMCIFMKHLRRHLKIQAYRCGLCEKHFNTYASLEVHQLNLHGAINEEKLKKKGQSQAIPSFSCDQCSRSFSTKGHLKEHVLGVHTQGSVACLICDKTFKTDKRMKKHLYSTHKQEAEAFRSKQKIEVFQDAALQIPPSDWQ